MSKLSEWRQLGATYLAKVRALDVLDKLPGGESALLGLLAALSSFYGFIIIVDGVLIMLAVTRPRRPPLWALLIALPIAVSSLWAPLPWWPLLTAARIVALAIVLRPGLPLLPFAVAFLTPLMVQAAFLILNINIPRPSGFAVNASMLGQVGLACLVLVWPLAGKQLWPPRVVAPNCVAALAGLVAAVTVGLAGARASAVAAAVFITWLRSRALAAVLALTLAVSFAGALNSGQLHRWTFGGLGNTVMSRAALLGPYEGLDGLPAGRPEFLYQKAAELTVKETGSLIAQPTEERIERVAALYPYIAPEFSWWGYGYGGFVPGTHTQAPHNVPVYAAYELGLLLIPVAVGGLLLLIKGRVSVPLILIVAVLWLVTEEQWSLGAGHWVLAVMAFALPAPKGPRVRARAHTRALLDSWDSLRDRVGRLSALTKRPRPVKQVEGPEAAKGGEAAGDLIMKPD